MVSEEETGVEENSLGDLDALLSSDGEVLTNRARVHLVKTLVEDLRTKNSQLNEVKEKLKLSEKCLAESQNSVDDLEQKLQVAQAQNPPSSICNAFCLYFLWFILMILIIAVLGKLYHAMWKSLNTCYAEKRQIEEIVSQLYEKLKYRENSGILDHLLEIGKIAGRRVASLI